MTSPTSPAPLRLPGRRSPFDIARDLLVVGLCALVVGGFLLSVYDGGRASRPAATSASGLSS